MFVFGTSTENCMLTLRLKIIITNLLNKHRSTVRNFRNLELTENKFTNYDLRALRLKVHIITNR